MRRPLLTKALVPVSVLALLGAACGDDDEEEVPVSGEIPTESDEGAAAGTIVEVAAGAGDFSTLVAAVEAAGLVDALSADGPYTVFAPTDEAFAAALDALGLTAEELLADTDTLTSILTYHVVEGELPAADVIAGGSTTLTTLNGADLEVTVDGDTVMVGDATVVATDVEASNGVIHVIDAVLLPPDDAAMDGDEAMDEGTEGAAAGTIVEVAAGAGDFSTLVAAVEAAGLVDALSADGPYTVFAPTDEAFAAALDALGLTAEELLADTDTLTSILTYHVVEGELPAADVIAGGSTTLTTLNGADLEVTVDGDTVMVGDATVVATDVEASNGVIHVIDAVLLPPAG